MSIRQFFTTIMFGFVFAFCVFYYQNVNHGTSQSNGRNPASEGEVIKLNEPKGKRLGIGSRLIKLLDFNKVGQGFQISIEAPNGIANTDQQETYLKAKITALKDFSGVVKYHWSIPEGAESLSADAPIADEDQPNELKNFKNKQSVQPEINLIGFSKEGKPKVVILQVFTEENGIKISQSAAFVTKDLYIPEIQNKDTENKDAPVLEAPATPTAEEK